MRPLIRLAKKLGQGNWLDPYAPATSIQEMQKTLAGPLIRELSKTPKEELEQVIRGIPRMLEKIPREELFLIEPPQFVDDQRYIQLKKFFNNVHAEVPFLPVHVFIQIGYAEWEQMNLQAYSAIARAKEGNGEERATGVMQAAQEVAELVYRPYLWSLAAMHQLLQGKGTSKKLTLGSLMRVTKQIKKEYPAPTNHEVTWLRNAAAHRQWKYHPNKDEVTLWGLHKPASTHDVDWLLDRVKKLYEEAGIIFPAARHNHMIRKLLVESRYLELALKNPDGQAASDDHEEPEAQYDAMEMMWHKFQQVRNLVAKFGEKGPFA